jgi:hypothetical protein
MKLVETGLVKLVPHPLGNVLRSRVGYQRKNSSQKFPTTLNLTERTLTIKTCYFLQFLWRFDKVVTPLTFEHDRWMI